MNRKHKKPVYGRCRLCRNVRRLRFSHVISESLYETSYASKHAKRPLAYIPWDSSKPIELNVQQGHREYLLCGPCEGHLSRWERDTPSIVYRRGKWSGTETALEDGPATIIEGVPYRDFKLFQLMQLWRASVSKHEAFAPVKLGTEHEEQLHQMLLNGEPGEPHDYACLVGDPRDEVVKAIMECDPPVWMDGYEHIKVYSFRMGGLLWSYFVSRDPFVNAALAPLILRPGGPLVIVHMDRPADDEKIAAYSDAGRRLAALRRPASSRVVEGNADLNHGGPSE